MHRSIRIAGCTFAALALASCAGGPPQAGGPHGDYRLSRARPEPLPSIGDPGKVAAADIAMALAAREEGQWSAFRKFAASGAVLHLPEGVVAARDWLAGRADPAEAVRWAPRQVWSSCDGSLAVSSGRFRDPDGLVGAYATVWELQNDRSYKWIYDLGAPDNPQPPPPPPDVEPSEDVIIVTELTSIEGRVADCTIGVNQPLPAGGTVPAGTSAARALSDDATLGWIWYHQPDGTRAMMVHAMREGEWVAALDFVVPAASE